MPPLARLPQFDEVLEEVLRREAETRAAFQAADGARHPARGRGGSGLNAQPCFAITLFFGKSCAPFQSFAKIRARSLQTRLLLLKLKRRCSLAKMQPVSEPCAGAHNLEGAQSPGSRVVQRSHRRP